MWRKVFYKANEVGAVQLRASEKQIKAFKRYCIVVQPCNHYCSYKLKKKWFGLCLAGFWYHFSVFPYSFRVNNFTMQCALTLSCSCSLQTLASLFHKFSKPKQNIKQSHLLCVFFNLVFSKLFLVFNCVGPPWIQLK